MTPSDLSVDTRLADPAAFVHRVEDGAESWCDGHDDCSVVLRVLFPVYAVTYSYAVESLLPWDDGSRERSCAIVPGRSDIADAPLGQYAASACDPETVDPRAAYADLRESTLVLDRTIDRERAESWLPDRLDDVATAIERRRDRWRERQQTTSDDAEARRLQRKIDDHRGVDLLKDLRAETGLTEAVDQTADLVVHGCTALYLPTYVVELTDDSGGYCYVAGRPDPDADPETWTPGLEWPADVLTDAIDEVDSFEALGTIVGDHDASADRASVRSGTRGSEGIREPDSVRELDAASVLTPTPDRDFSDVGGNAELLSTLRRTIVDPLTHADRYASYGLSVVNGVLLHGPPGCGKTHVAGALAGELGFDYLDARPADLMSKYMGEPAVRVEDLFAIARANQPCLVFLDEIDGITAARDGSNANQSERQLVTQLLVELEAIDGEDVIVVGATNHLDDVDDAIRRSGRFDERIEVPPPDADARRAILEVHLRDRPTAEDLDLEPAVEVSAGFAGSDLERLVESAARRAMAADRPITGDDLASVARDAETSIDGWVGRYEFLARETDGTGRIVDPDDAEYLSAGSIVQREVKRSFDDVGGMDDLLETMGRTVLDPLRDRATYERYGLDPTSGILLYGPPGCGKSYVSRALAGELDQYFVQVGPATLTGETMGEPAQRVADLFAIARANQPCLVVLDEIDAIAGSRSEVGADSLQTMVNQLLTELESIDDERVIVVGTTNLPDDLDDAIRRSGRFDERIEVPPPDADARRAILEVQLADRPIADDIVWADLVEATAGYAASDLAHVADEAAQRALRADSVVTTERLLAAVECTESSIASWLDRYGGGDRTEASLSYIN
ncbi:AAA family ATPase [Halococcoides cellulosivorans]|uniref:Endonuclease n=1 Tax=Halococcoides cellulosivorans TaxID=1679096 RepID=A0A2R4X2C3_9EURY|nr:ATP-binding protein [Halococcoides cellulosivorans]AWB27948.1 endonuclease [Halococcoides cellulosivorans]